MLHLRWLSGLSLFVVASSVFGQAARPPVSLTDEGRRVHAATFVFDGHNDLPWEMWT
jgi:hypothetical protein